jgi:lipoprotein NlpI
LRLVRQADTNYQSGRYDLARPQYEALVAANARFTQGHVRLGVIAWHEGDLPAATSRFEAALRIDPHYEQAVYNLAMLRLNDAASLLATYVDASPPAANREPVLVLLGQLKAFGARQ